MDSGDPLDLEQVLNEPFITNGRSHLPTVSVTIVFVVLVAALTTAASVLYREWPTDAAQCEPLFYFLYTHAVFWFLTLIFDHYLKWRHHVLYLHGYLSSSEHLRKLAAYPFHLVSLCNGLLLGLIAWYHQRNEEFESACRLPDLMSPVGGVLALISVEALILVVLLVTYGYKVYMFNCERRLPDVEISSDWAPMHSFVSDELGFEEKGGGGVNGGVEDLLRKQADLIRFYRDESEALKKKILALNCQMRGESIN